DIALANALLETPSNGLRGKVAIAVEPQAHSVSASIHALRAINPNVPLLIGGPDLLKSCEVADEVDQAEGVAITCTVSRHGWHCLPNRRRSPRRSPIMQGSICRNGMMLVWPDSGSPAGLRFDRWNRNTFTAVLCASRHGIRRHR